MPSSAAMAAVPGDRGRAPRTLVSLYGRAPTRTRGGWGFYAARAAAGRPICASTISAHRGGVGGGDRRDLGGADGTARALDPGAALRYQHAAQDRDADIAERLSAIITK